MEAVSYGTPVPEHSIFSLEGCSLFKNAGFQPDCRTLKLNAFVGLGLRKTHKTLQGLNSRYFVGFTLAGRPGVDSNHL